MVKTQHGRTTFGCFSVIFCGRRNGFCTCIQANRGRFAVVPKTMAIDGRAGRLKMICKNEFRMAGAVQETPFKGQGADY